MSNFETTTTISPAPSIGVSETFFYIAQLSEGTILSIVNFSLILAILISRKTRQQKEFIIICGKIFADGWYGLSYLIWGIDGLVTTSRGDTPVYFTQRYCLFNVFENTMFTFAAPLVGLSITMVSLDRLFAACRPTWYYKLDVGYAWKMNGMLFSICFTGVIVAYGLAIAAGNTLLPIPGCSTQQAVGGLWIFLRMARFGGTAFGIVLYIPILIVLFQRKHLWASIHGKKLLQVTITIGLTAVSDFFLFLVPEFFIMTNLLSSYSEFCYLAMVSKGTVNMFIYTLRHRELRKALLGMVNFGCRKTAISSIHLSKNTESRHQRATVMVERNLS